MSILKIIKKNWKKVFILSMSILLVNGLKLMIPYVLEELVNHFEKMLNYILLLCTLIISTYLLQLFYEKIKKRYAIKFQTQEAVELVQLMYGMEYEKIKSMEPTYLVNRIMEAVSNIFEFIVNSVSQLSGGIVSVIFIIFMIFRYNVWLSLCYLFYALISFLGYRWINRKLLVKSIKLQDIVANCYKNILCFLTNVDFLKLSYDFNIIKKHIKSNFQKSNRENAEVGYYAACISMVLDLFLDVMQYTIYIAVFYLTYIGKINFAQVASIVALNGLFKNAMQILNSTNIGLRDVKASIHFINEILAKCQEKNKGNKKIDKIRKVKANFKEIAYEDNFLVERGNLSAECGDVIGIMGESGTGKSTLLKVMLGIKSSSKSLIEFNGILSSEISNKEIRKKVGYISQNKAIFPISVKENFLIYDLDGSNEQKYKKLLDMEGFQKFKNIEENEVVLEGANNLSGGDQQKIAVGRYLLEQPDILILDEFSNSLDKETEEYIMKLIVEQYRDKIIVLITHDKKLLKWCTKIYELKNKVLNERDKKFFI